MLNQTIIKRILILCFQLFLCNSLLAQTGDTIKLTKQKLQWLGDFISWPTAKNIQFEPLNGYNSFRPETLTPNIYPLNKLSAKKNILNGLSYRQLKVGNIYPNFGSFEYFGNSFIFSADKKLSIETGFGLVLLPLLIST